MPTTTIPEIVNQIPLLFNQVSDSNTFYQEFQTSGESRAFAERMRKQCGDFVNVEERMGNRVNLTILDTLI